MSLKGFHIVFVTVASLMFAFLVLWSFVITEEKSVVASTLGYLGIAGLLVMPFYGFYFLRKAARMNLQ